MPRLILLLSTIFTIQLIYQPSTYAQISFNPQAGLSAATLSSDPDNAESSARFGYQVGAYLRIGDRLYFQPGVFWQRSSTELRPAEELDFETLKDDINLDAIFVSAGLGYKLIETEPLTLRIQGALAGTFITDVQENLLNLDIENFNGVLAGVPIGIGVDLLNLITVDATYELGLTNVFDEIFGFTVDATNNVFRLNVGLVF